MNPHYAAYPPPGVVFYYPQPHLGHAAALGTPYYGGQSLNGPHNHHPHPHAYQVDTSGWYYPPQHRHQHQPQAHISAPAKAGHAPLHPPGLPLPVPRQPQPPFAAETTSETVEDTREPEGMGVHAFWAGRLAPLPGHQSPSVLLPMKGMGAMAASREKMQMKNASSKPEAAAATTPVELRPPQSFFGAAYERTVASPTATSESTLIDEVSDLSRFLLVNLLIVVVEKQQYGRGQGIAKVVGSFNSYQKH